MSVSTHYDVLFDRHPANPILSAADWPYPAHSVFNAGATRLTDGTTLLLCRVEDRRGHSHLCAARSVDGVTDWTIDPRPTFEADPVRYPEELWGVEDPRITWVPELAQWAIAYTAFGRAGPGVALALTRDFRTFERCGLVMPPDDKDAALLPYRVHGKFAMIHRPMHDSGSHVWISYSPDLRNWGGRTLVLAARRGGWWDANKVGLSPPLIESPRGWLMIYHGVRHTASGSLYRLGLALLDRENPATVLLRGDAWVFGPEAPYERFGDVDNVTFPCGVTVGTDGDLLNVYYGGADSCVALATTRISRLLAWLDAHGRIDSSN
ncbi:MAG: hypothetical protein MUF00_12810 [Gemmatimonadaceae bacterium]|jgi:predicted GH43/DUF377 family glycosyl hydrolase|nr:hypothetical protein [Gemmatimonadaceae bacterium]